MNTCAVQAMAIMLGPVWVSGCYLMWLHLVTPRGNELKPSGYAAVALWPLVVVLALAWQGLIGAREIARAAKRARGGE